MWQLIRARLMIVECISVCCTDNVNYISPVVIVASNCCKLSISGPRNSNSGDSGVMTGESEVRTGERFNVETGLQGTTSD